MLLVLAITVVFIVRVTDFDGKFYSKKCRELQLLHTSGMPKSFAICVTYLLLYLLLLLCFPVFSFLIFLL